MNESNCRTNIAKNQNGETILAPSFLPDDNDEVFQERRAVWYLDIMENQDSLLINIPSMELTDSESNYLKEHDYAHVGEIPSCPTSISFSSTPESLSSTTESIFDETEIIDSIEIDWSDHAIHIIEHDFDGISISENISQSSNSDSSSPITDSTQLNDTELKTCSNCSEYPDPSSLSKPYFYHNRREILEAEFKINPHPSEEKLIELGKFLCVKESLLAHWFRHRNWAGRPVSHPLTPGGGQPINTTSSEGLTKCQDFTTSQKEMISIDHLKLNHIECHTDSTSYTNNMEDSTPRDSDGANSVTNIFDYSMEKKQLVDQQIEKPRQSDDSNAELPPQIYSSGDFLLKLVSPTSTYSTI